jgi:methionyl-tRNA formyltransferase
MVQAMTALESGRAIETPQPEAGATYAMKIAKAESRIDWSKRARDIDCRIRGLSPAPGAWCEAKGERLKVLYAEPAAGRGAPGEILDSELTVAAGDGALRLMRLQRAGRGALEPKEFLRGFALQPGDRLT